MTALRPRMLLVDDDVPRRLELTSIFSGRCEVQPAGYADDPVRLARTGRPDVVVLTTRGRAPETTLRMCRTLRSDVRPIRLVAIAEAGPRPRGAFVAMELWMASGYLGLPSEPERVATFIDALLRGERPQVAPASAAPGGLRSLWRRLRPS